MEHYFPPLLPVRNIAVAAALCAIYLVLCSYVVKQKLNVHSRLDKTQMLLFLQALCICSSSAIASILYVYFNFFETPYYLVAAGNVIWQLSHGGYRHNGRSLDSCCDIIDDLGAIKGIHGLVYIVLNRQVRHMAHSMMVCRMVTSSNTKITQHSVISRKVGAKNDGFLQR
ncbi:hypothetical protein ANCCEY_08058 [Ancylostoma ceylanicum]|uniref:Uncharacterized protein n=1 Tax=Ancylostoma ceylanicum TaxID=53326 RepID=A0A0D6LLS0_9BILA|nr:hypothetical protein ANCCEY_08058 [Ancylostoma ceylanicum]